MRGPARQLRWASGVGATGLAAIVGLWVAARVVQGFSKDYALAQSLFFVGSALGGAWLMGSLLLQHREQS